MKQVNTRLDKYWGKENGKREEDIWRKIQTKDLKMCKNAPRRVKAWKEKTDETGRPKKSRWGRQEKILKIHIQYKGRKEIKTQMEKRKKWEERKFKRERRRKMTLVHGRQVKSKKWRREWWRDNGKQDCKSKNVRVGERKGEQSQNEQKEKRSKEMKWYEWL